MESITIEENVANIIRIENNIYTHKQIEFADGKIFMRIKKRVLTGTA